MDAVKYIKERERMCEKHPFCGDCPLREINKEGTSCKAAIKNHAEEAVSVVEKWSKEHPKKTNGDKIWEMIPSDMRSTTVKLADSKAFKWINMINEKDHIELRIVKDWWDAPYKGGE